MTSQLDTIVVIGPDFQQLSIGQTYVTPVGDTQNTLAYWLANAASGSSGGNTPQNPLATIYIDSVGGDDSAAANSEATPFQTLARAMTSAIGGTALYLKCGSVFRETLTINQSGVTVSQYGTGANPIISGAVLITNGAASSGNLYLELFIQEYTTPVAVHTETYANNVLSAYWTTQAGAISTTILPPSQSVSWRVGGSDMEISTFASGTYLEYVTEFYLDGATTTATAGGQTRIMGAEGSAWNAATGIFVWITCVSTGVYTIGLGVGTGATVTTSFTASSWTSLRFVLSCDSGSASDYAALYIGGASTPTIQLTGLTLASVYSGIDWGLWSYQSANFYGNFGQFSNYNAPSVSQATNNWYIEDVVTVPNVVTLDGTAASRQRVKSTLTTAGQWWYDGYYQRLYIYNTQNPLLTWNDIEYAQRNWPVQVNATGVSLSNLVITMNNVDDGTIGVTPTFGTFEPTLTNVTGINNASNFASYFALPGREDCPWKTPLGPNTSYAPLAASFNALQTGLSLLANSPGLWQAQTSDRVVKLLYGGPNMYYYTSTGQWLRTGNSPTVENQIRALSSNTFPSTPFGSASRYVYQTVPPTEANKKSHIPPPYPFAPYPNSATGAALTFHVPSSALPGPDTDGHFAVLQPDGIHGLDVYNTVLLSDGTVVGESFNVSNWTGLLDGYNAGMKASVLNCYAGVIRDAEANALSIGHAIAVALPAAQLRNIPVYPALCCDTDNSYAGLVPMGARLAVPFSVNLAAIGWSTTMGLAIATALQRFGCIATDTGGGGLTFYNELNATNPYLTTFNLSLVNDLLICVENLCRVTSPLGLYDSGSYANP